jgi:dipeptide/tripeptide permease
LHLSLRAAAVAAGRTAGRRAVTRAPPPLTPEQWRAIVALLVLFVPNTLFWATYEQMGNTTILWIDSRMSTAPSACSDGSRKSRRRGFSPSIRS